MSFSNYSILYDNDEWCDDERSPYIATKNRTKSLKSECSASQMLKDVVSELNTTKMSLLWNEVQYRNWEFEYPILSCYYYDSFYNVDEDLPTNDTKPDSDSESENGFNDEIFDKWFKNPYAYT